MSKPEILTFLHALRVTGWGDPADNCGAIAHRIMQGKWDSPAITWAKVPSILDTPLGYDYAKREELYVFAWDDDFIYIQDNSGGCTEFHQVPRNPSAYWGHPICVVGTKNW